MRPGHYNRDNNELVELPVTHQSIYGIHVVAEICKPHAIQIRQTGCSEVLNWKAVDGCVVASGKVRINVNQRFALKDAADANKASEDRILR